MLSTIITKEIRDQLVSTRFAISFGLAAVLIILSFYSGAANYKIGVAQHESAKAESVRQLEGLTDWMNFNTHRIFLPPLPLACLVTGITNDIGRTTLISGRGEPIPSYSRFNEDPVFAIFRFLDLEFVFTIVLSLFAIVLGYDAICGEKERGTLRLSFANAVPRSQFMLGKTIGLLMAVIIPLLIPIAIGVFLLIIMNIPMTGEEWVRLTLIILTGFLYVGAFLILSVLASSLTLRSASSFLIILIAWITSVLIIPRSAVLLAARSVPVPSVDEIMAQKSVLSAQLSEEFKDQLAQYKSIANLPIDQQMAIFNQFNDSIANQRDDKLQEFSSRLEEERNNRQRQQERLALSLARISPSASLTLAFTSLAGTSLSLKNQYLQEVREYKKVFTKFIREKTGQNLGPGARILSRGNENDKKKEPINPAELPVFNFRGELWENSFASALPDIGLLAILNLIFFALAFVAFHRYDLR